MNRKPNSKPPSKGTSSPPSNLSGNSVANLDWQIAEAVLFSSTEPVDEETLSRYLPNRNLAEVLRTLESHLKGHGICLAKVANKWQLRTRLELAGHLALQRRKKITLSPSALEVLAAIAYFQPVTRVEMEEMRSRKVSTTVLETLMKLNWIAPKGRRQTPGKPVTWGTTEKFLIHFGLESLEALPKAEELGKFSKTAKVTPNKTAPTQTDESPDTDNPPDTDNSPDTDNPDQTEQKEPTKNSSEA